VGATDSLVDVVGAAIGFDYFGFDEIHASPLPMSRGEVRCAHGVLPVPAPATVELLKGVPLERTRVTGELVTPTGAAILTSVVSHFGECPLQAIARVGIGFGDRAIPGRPNMLRLLVGEGFPIVVVEADIDDMNPEFAGYAMERLFAAGAQDVTFLPIQMKKDRPALRLSCIVPWEAKDRAIDAMLRETTTFGVRYWPAERRVLTRELSTERVRRERLTFKVGFDPDGKAVKAMPEFEGLRKLARRTHRPLPELYAEALAEGRRLIARRRKTP
jgi:pyridinium-3,5-bisthiocarboxylic acid mononucleotide nickel chelatase